jgi:hypothetical protein
VNPVAGGPVMANSALARSASVFHLLRLGLLNRVRQHLGDQLTHLRSDTLDPSTIPVRQSAALENAAMSPAHQRRGRMEASAGICTPDCADLHPWNGMKTSRCSMRNSRRRIGSASRAHSAPIPARRSTFETSSRRNRPLGTVGLMRCRLRSPTRIFAVPRDPKACPWTSRSIAPIPSCRIPVSGVRNEDLISTS